VITEVEAGRARRRSGAPDAETQSWQTLALSSSHRPVGPSDKGQCDSCGRKILRKSCGKHLFKWTRAACGRTEAASRVIL